jgi:hypothetical protein
VINLRLVGYAVAAMLVAAIVARYYWLTHEVSSQKAEIEAIRQQRTIERANSEAEIFSAKQLAKIREKGAPHEINLSVGHHTLDF